MCVTILGLHAAPYQECMQQFVSECNNILGVRATVSTVFKECVQLFLEVRATLF